MDGFVEEAFASTLGSLSVARILFDVGDQAGIEHALPIVRGIKAAIKVEVPSCRTSLGCQPKQLMDDPILGEDIPFGQSYTLAFVKHMHRFIALDGLLASMERGKPSPWINAAFDKTMLLLNGMITNDK